MVSGGLKTLRDTAGLSERSSARTPRGLWRSPVRVNASKARFDNDRALTWLLSHAALAALGDRCGAWFSASRFCPGCGSLMLLTAVFSVSTSRNARSAHFAIASR